MLAVGAELAFARLLKNFICMKLKAMQQNCEDQVRETVWAFSVSDSIVFKKESSLIHIK